MNSGQTRKPSRLIKRKYTAQSRTKDARLTAQEENEHAAQQKIIELTGHLNYHVAWVQRLQSEYESLARENHALKNSLTWRAARKILTPLDIVRQLITGQKIPPSNPAPSIAPAPSEEQAKQNNIHDFAWHRKNDLFRRNGKPRLLLVSHDASRTGAPLIILTIGKYLKELGYGVRTICLRGGDLEAEFRKLGPYDCLEDIRSRAYWQISDHQAISQLIDGYSVHSALVNSAECHTIIPALHEAEIPHLWLIHEFLNFYDNTRITKELLFMPGAIIFPAPLLQEIAEKRIGCPIPNAHILPQGVFDENFPKGNREDARAAIRKSLDLCDDTFIVLGCGYLSYRKGCDIFNATARYFEKYHPHVDIAFVWLGTLDSNEHVYSGHISVDRQNSENLFYVGQKEDVSQYFLASDMFYLTSRLEPYPCVGLEAMAAGLPVLCFDGTTGQVETIREQRGIIIDSELSFPAAAEKILEFYTTPQRLEQYRSEAYTRHFKKTHSYDAYVEKILNVVATVKSIPQQIVSGKDLENPAPIKIFYLASDWGISGANTAMEDLLVAMRDTYGHEIKILCYKSDFYIYEQQNMPPFEHLFFPHSEHDDCRVGFLNFLSEQGPCVVITGYDSLLNSIASALPDTVAVIGISHSDDPFYYKQFLASGRYWNRHICVSEEIGAKSNALLPHLADRTNVAHIYAIKESLIPATRHHNETVTIKFIYAGRLVHNQKRADEYTELIRALERTGMQFTFELIGSPPLRPDGTFWPSADGVYEKLLAELHNDIAQKRVSMPGKLPRAKIFERLRDCTFFVLLSDFEGLPVSLLEAMSQGCIPVVPDIKSGIPELVRNGWNGIIMSGRNYDQWAEKLAEIAQDPEALDMMSRNAIETIRSGFTQEKAVKEFNDIIMDAYKEAAFGNYKRPEVLRIGRVDGDCIIAQ